MQAGQRALSRLRRVAADRLGTCRLMMGDERRERAETKGDGALRSGNTVPAR